MSKPTYAELVLLADTFAACIETGTLPAHGSPCHRRARQFVDRSGCRPKRKRRRLPPNVAVRRDAASASPSTAPCPFCGIVPKVRKGLLGYSVECNNPECYQLVRRMGGRAWVVEQWNRRPNTQITDSERKGGKR